MDLYDRTYQAVSLPGTTLAEALGIVWACGDFIDDSKDFFETAEAMREFHRMWNAIFALDSVVAGDVDRIPENEYGDNAHREDGEYCVRISVFSYANDVWDDTHEYMISIGTDIGKMSPNIKVCFQRVRRDSSEGCRSARFETLCSVTLDEQMTDFLLQTR